MPELDEDFSIGQVSSPSPVKKKVKRDPQLEGVNDELLGHWDALQKEAKQAGLTPVLKSGFRTAKHQNDLHKAGYPTKGNDGYINVSPHQRGDALDISWAPSQKAAGRKLLADYAKRHGLNMPGDEPWHISTPAKTEDFSVGQVTEPEEDFSVGAIEHAHATPGLEAPEIPKTRLMPQVAAEDIEPPIPTPAEYNAPVAPTAAPAPVRPAVRPAVRGMRPALTQRPARADVSGRDLSWHLGMTPEEFQGLSPAQQRRAVSLVEAGVIGDQKKKAAGQSLTPSVSYINANRAKLGLGSKSIMSQQGLPTAEEAQGNSKYDIRPMLKREVGISRATAEMDTQSVLKKAAAKGLSVDEVRKQVVADLSKPETYSDEQSGVTRYRQRLSTPDAATVEHETAARLSQVLAEQERQERTAKLSTADRIIQYPKSVAGGVAQGVGGTVKGVGIVAKKIADTFADTGLDADETYTYQLGDYISKKVPEILHSNPDLEQEWLAGKAPQAIGQSLSFLLGGAVTKAPGAAKTITAMLATGMTTADAYDEIKRMGGTERQALNGGILAGGLLGPTELIGLGGALEAMHGTARATSILKAIKEGGRAALKDVLEGVPQEALQELGQGIITGNHRSISQILEAGALGGLAPLGTSLPIGAIKARPARGSLGRSITSVREKAANALNKIAEPEAAPAAPAAVEPVAEPAKPVVPVTPRKRVATPVEKELTTKLVKETEEKRSAERKAETDDLTGLPNQRAWRKAESRIDSDPSKTVLAIDLKNFKVHNSEEQGGEANGDKVLQKVAATLKKAAKLGEGIQVFRKGGDEFRVEVPDAQVKAVKALIQKLNPDTNIGEVPVGLSIGAGKTSKAAEAAMSAHKKTQGVALRANKPLEIVNKSGETESVTLSSQEILTQIKRRNTGKLDEEATKQLLGNAKYELKEVPVKGLKTYGTAGAERVGKFSKLSGAAQPPIIINSKGEVIDGKHRLGASKARGEKTVRAWVPAAQPKIKAAVETGTKEIAEPKQEAYYSNNGREVDAAVASKIAGRGASILKSSAENGKTNPVQPVTNEAVDALHKSIEKEWGGSSFSLQTNQPHDGKTGFAGGVLPNDQTITLPIKEALDKSKFRAAVIKARKKFQAELGRKDHFLGVFRDDKKGTVTFEPSIIVKTKGEAEAIATHLNSDGGVYDYATGDGVFPVRVKAQAPGSVPLTPEQRGVKAAQERVKKAKVEAKKEASDVGPAHQALQDAQRDSKSRALREHFAKKAEAKAVSQKVDIPKQEKTPIQETKVKAVETSIKPNKLKDLLKTGLTDKQVSEKLAESGLIMSEKVVSLQRAKLNLGQWQSGAPVTLPKNIEGVYSTDAQGRRSFDRGIIRLLDDSTPTPQFHFDGKAIWANDALLGRLEDAKVLPKVSGQLLAGMLLQPSQVTKILQTWEWPSKKHPEMHEFAKLIEKNVEVLRGGIAAEPMTVVFVNPNRTLDDSVGTRSHELTHRADWGKGGLSVNQLPQDIIDYLENRLKPFRKAISDSPTSVKQYSTVSIDVLASEVMAHFAGGNWTGLGVSDSVMREAYVTVIETLAEYEIDPRTIVEEAIYNEAKTIAEGIVGEVAASRAEEARRKGSSDAGERLTARSDLQGEGQAGAGRGVERGNGELASRESKEREKLEQSTRVPTAVKATENAVKESLKSDYEALKKDPSAAAKNLKLMQDYPNFKKGSSYETIVNHIADNLVWLHSKVPAAIRKRSKKWYVGANKIAGTLASQHDISLETSSGVLAVLSPQMDWHVNVSLAKRLLDIYHSKQDYKWDAKMEKTALRIFTATPELRSLYTAIRGRTLGELETPARKAAWFRAYDETYNSKSHELVTPEGDFGGMRKNKDGSDIAIKHQTVQNTAKAVAILEDSSYENIHNNLGGSHKVRNFFNNIVNPDSRNGHTTIDTHAVAAGLLRPLGGINPEVAHNFGQQSAKSSITGVKGTYPVYHEAYKRAAERLGMLSRELQSITWEGAKALFPRSIKNAAAQAKFDEIWRKQSNGKITAEEAREQTFRLAGGFDVAEWADLNPSGKARPDSRGAGEAGTARQQENLFSVERSGEGLEKASGPRAGRADARGTTAKQLGIDPKWKGQEGFLNVGDIVRDVARVAAKAIAPKTATPATGPEIKAKPGQVKERSFPQSAAKSGHKATALLYNELTNQASLDAATARIKRDGPDKVLADLATSKEVGSEDIAAGILLAKKAQKDGDAGKELQVIDALAEKLTKAGQAVQAASLINRLSPEGALLKGTRILKDRVKGKDVKLTPAQATKIKSTAKNIRDAKTKVAEYTEKEERLKKGEGTQADQIEARLAAKADEARKELAKLKGQGGFLNLGSKKLPPALQQNMHLYTAIGAHEFSKLGGIDKIARWKAEMVKVEPLLEPFLTTHLYKEAYGLYDNTRKAVLQANREKQAQKANPNATPAELQAIINEKHDAQTRARRESIEMQRIYNELGSGSFHKAAVHAGDIMGLTRAIESSLDLSGSLRQTKAALLRHPKVWARAFGKQLKAFNTKEYERLLSAIELDPDAKYASRFKLDLTGVDITGMMSSREEGFQSGFARKIPLVKHSEQAYTVMLDYTRMGWFKDYMNALRRLGLDPDNPADAHHFEKGAQLVNNATGRGDWGNNKAGDFLRNSSAVFNQVLFSPRFWASRLSLIKNALDPRNYDPRVIAAAGKDVLGVRRTALSQEARVEGLKTTASFLSLVGLQLALASLAGAKVGLDPEDPDFLKASWRGKYHVDFSAGLQGNIRTFLRLFSSVKNGNQGGRSKGGQAPGEILRDFTRKKLSPNASIIVDMFASKQSKGFGMDWRGKDFLGRDKYMFGKPGSTVLQRVNPLAENSSVIAQKFLPMIAGDMKEIMFDNSPDMGAAPAIAGSILGEGVQVYTAKPKRGKLQF